MIAERIFFGKGQVFVVSIWRGPSFQVFRYQDTDAVTIFGSV